MRRFKKHLCAKKPAKFPVLSPRSTGKEVHLLDVLPDGHRFWMPMSVQYLSKVHPIQTSQWAQISMQRSLVGPPYLCSTRQWLDEGWIVGGYSPDIVLICMAFIYRICMQYPHFTNAYDLSTRHLSIPVLYPPVTCACPPYIYDRHLYLQFIQRMSAVIYNTRSACFIHVIF